MPPTMLMDALQAVRRRVKLLGVLYGVGIAVAAFVALLLGVILFDYLLNLPAWPRLVLGVGSLVVIGYVIARWVWRPARSKLSLSDVAGRLERAFPQFDDRLRSTVNFVGEGSGRGFGSDVMRDRVMSEAAKMASELDLNRAIIVKPVWHAAGAGVGALVLMLVLALVTSPTYRNIALARLFSPFGAPAWPKRVMIEMVGSVPNRVPVGQRFDLRMKLSKGDSNSTKARIFYQLDDGPVQQEFMNRGSDGVYLASLDAKADATKAASSMKVWMTAGDDRKELAPITVLPRLAIMKVEAIVTPPPYVGDAFKPVTFNLTEGPALAAAGSDVGLKISFNKPLANGTPVDIKPLIENGKAPAIAWSRAGDTMLMGKWTAGESLRFHVVARDTDSFQNAGLEEYEVIVRPDQSPTVQIENPRRNEERTPVAVVPLQGVAEDDYGISTMKLVVDRLNDKKHWEVNLVADGKPVEGVTWNRAEPSADRLRFRGNYGWDLSKLDSAGLKPGDVLEYSLQVTDNFNLNGEFHAPVASGKLRISIVSQEQFTELITNELRQAAAAIHDIHARQGRTKEETSDLAKDTEKKPAFDAGDKAVAERLGNQQGTSALQSKQVAGKLDAVVTKMEENKSPANDLKQLASDVKDVLNNVAENPMKDASAAIAMAPQQNDPAQRAGTMKSATDNQQVALDKLQGALDRLGSVGSLQQTMDKIKELLKEQQRISKETADVGAKNIGKTPDQMSPEDQAKLKKAAEDQKALAAKTDKAIADMQKMAETMKKSDPTSAEAMKQSAQTGQNQQVSPNQSKAAKAAGENKQSAAQSAQKQAEMGLQMMLDDLREAERRKLEELAKKLAEIQQQLQILVRRQAGHNLDNLGLQGRTIDKLEAKLSEELLAYAERVKTALQPQPQLPALTNSQEQTERNARDIAQTVEKLPNGAEPSSILTRAASKMERAIVALRAKDLTGAYEPPQVEALAALVDAKKIIDEQKKAVDQKRDEQQKEAVRQAYIKIKAEQEKINGDTARIDKASGGKVAGADANLKREDAIRLGQMPAEQAKLASRTQELEEALAAVNSVVYIWANKDIVASMNGVRDDLAKPTTAAPTQIEQARIVEQLDAMIKNLEVHLLDPKFAKQGGGGGGQCGPKLPTEAELRLLRALQIAGVNAETKKLALVPQPDKAKSFAVGGRQGDMRNLLDQMLQKSSNGEAKLRPEPDNKDQLPEEQALDKAEQQELQQALAGDDPNPEQIAKDMMTVGDRMARSKQRLALNNDPGKTTQLIQDRIVKDLDSLIEQSRKQACASGSPQSKPGQGQQMAKAKADRQVADVMGGSKSGSKTKGAGKNPAAASLPPSDQATQTDISAQIKESATEWGHISPRTRNAVIEGASEQVIEKYRRYVEDYYKGVAEKGAERE